MSLPNGLPPGSESWLWMGWDVTQPNTAPVNTPSRRPTNEMGRDAFLMLLMAQLQHQDPLNPMENHEFVAQMAQFSALEQMQNMNQSIQAQQANNMLGKWVEGSYFNDTTMEWREVSGFAEAVVIRLNQPFLRVANGPGLDDFDLIPVSRVERVFPDLFLSSLTNFNQNVITSQNLALIGRTVMAVTRGADGRPNGFVEGTVDQIRFDDQGNPILIVGTREVLAREVMAVSEGGPGGRRLIGSHIYVPAANNEGFVRGRIDDVRFIHGETAQEDRVVLVVDNREHELFNIGLTFDALGFIGRDVAHGGISGKVESVRLIGGRPYLRVGVEVTDEDGNTTWQERGIISFMALRGINAG